MDRTEANLRSFAAAAGAGYLVASAGEPIAPVVDVPDPAEVARMLNECLSTFTKLRRAESSSS